MKLTRRVGGVRFQMGRAGIICCLGGASCGGESAVDDAEALGEAVQAAVTPKKVTSLADLRAMTGSGAYELAGDIDASATSSTAFVPIGTQASPFRGTFDGKGFKINNLTIAGNRTYAGMFGYVQGATISNVKLNNVSLTNNQQYTGALVGHMASGSSLANCEASGRVSGQDFTGGLVGSAAGSSIAGVKATNLTVRGTAYVGGLIGLSGATSLLNSSTSGGSVTGTSATGGLAGWVQGASASFLSATGLNVTGGANTGGIVGVAESSSLFYDSASGTVRGAGNSGGLVGNISDATVFQSSGSVTVTGTSNVGGLVGVLTRSAVDRGLVSGDISGTSNVGGIVGIMAGALSRRAVVTNSYIDDKSTGSASVVTGGSPVGMAIGLVQRYCDIKRNYAIGRVTGSATTIGGFIGEVFATGIARSDDEPRAYIEEIFTRVQVDPIFDSGTNPVYAGGLIGYLTGAQIDNINIAGSVKGRQYVGGALGYVVNSGANRTNSVVRSVLSRGEVTNVATANRSGLFGGSNAKFARCYTNYWDTTSDGGTAPSIPDDGESLCQAPKTANELKAPERRYVDADHPNGNYDIFTYGGVLNRAFAAQYNLTLHQCQMGSGSDGDFGFGFCYGILDGFPPPVWQLNSSSEYNTLVNIPNPQRQPKN